MTEQYRKILDEKWDAVRKPILKALKEKGVDIPITCKDKELMRLYDEQVKGGQED